VLCRYSLDVQRGELVLVNGPASQGPLLAAVTAEITRLGGHPLIRPTLTSAHELVLRVGTKEQLEYISPLEWHETEVPTKFLSIWADTNTRYLSAVPNGNQGLRRAAYQPLRKRIFARLGSGEAHWCGVSMPTQAFAQEAGMAYADFEEFVYGAGHLDDPDPVAAWRAVSERQQKVIERLDGVAELRFVAADTDLTVNVAGRTWMNADGHQNFPDGEIYTSPDETATKGHVTFSFDAAYDGHLVEGVRLWFEDGRVVREEARRGEPFLREMLDMDDGARLLGEVAFGLNPEIQRATRNIAFDEKIGGTFHVALGAAFPECGGSNESALHWDMVCDLRSGGEVFADGELLMRDGALV
jgi:aminopeptidase